MLLVAGAAVLGFVAWRREPVTVVTVLFGVIVAMLIEYQNDRFYPHPPLYYVPPRIWVLPDSNIPVSMMAYVTVVLTACAQFGTWFQGWLRSKEWSRLGIWPAAAIGQIFISVGLAALFEFGFVSIGLLTWRLADPLRGPLLGTATAAALCLGSYLAASVTVGVAKSALRGLRA
jgi:hypothetical protein